MPGGRLAENTGIGEERRPRAVPAGGMDAIEDEHRRPEGGVLHERDEDSLTCAAPTAALEQVPEACPRSDVRDEADRRLKPAPG